MIWKIGNIFIALFCVLATASHAQNGYRGGLTTSNGVPMDFVTVDQRVSNLIRIDPHAHWDRYRVYSLSPAAYEPENCGQRLSSRDAQKVSATVDRSLQKTFKKSAEEKGEVLEVRPIIQAVKRTSTVLNVLGFAAIQAPISFGGASVRYELFDGRSGRQIGEISCKRSARPWNVYPWNVLQNFEALGQGSVILKSDSKRLRKDLDRLTKLPIDAASKPAASSVSETE